MKMMYYLLAMALMSCYFTFCQFMAENGNQLMKAKYEAAVPIYYYKPTHKDCQ